MHTANNPPTTTTPPAASGDNSSGPHHGNNSSSVESALAKSFEHLAPYHLQEAKVPRPPALAPEAVVECVELLRFVCFPDIIRCPLPSECRKSPLPSSTSTNRNNGQDDDFCRQSPAGSGEEVTTSTALAHFCHVRAVRNALKRFAVVLEEQLVNALMISEFEKRISITSSTRIPRRLPPHNNKTSNNKQPAQVAKTTTTAASTCDYLEFPTAALLGVEKSFTDLSQGEFEQCCEALRIRGHAIVAALIERIPKLKVLLALDVEASFVHDVAAESLAEVILCYPGVQCLIHHRLAHELLHLGAPRLFARLISEISHSKFGMDIHPQTTIGHSCFLDHGTGIVIGATCIIGNRVSIYQGATLGAKAFPVDPETGRKIKSLPRHPIIEDDVVVYANATVLGRITVGKNSILAGSVWVDKDVPPNSLVLQKPVTVTKTKQQKKEAAVTKMVAETTASGKTATTAAGPPTTNSVEARPFFSKL